MRSQVLQGLLTRSFRVSRRQLHGAGGTRVATAIVTEAAGSVVSLAVAGSVIVGSPRSPRVPSGIFEHRGEWACVVGDLCSCPSLAMRERAEEVLHVHLLPDSYAADDALRPSWWIAEVARDSDCQWSVACSS